MLFEAEWSLFSVIRTCGPFKDTTSDWYCKYKSRIAFYLTKAELYISMLMLLHMYVGLYFLGILEVQSCQKKKKKTWDKKCFHSNKRMNTEMIRLKLGLCF